MVQIVQVGTGEKKKPSSRTSRSKDDSKLPNENEKPVRKYPPKDPTRKRTPAIKPETDVDKDEPIMKIIVAIDFGTTYSGVAFVNSSSTANDIAIVTDWPGQGENSLKVPTRLYYDVKTGELKAWGHQDSADMLSSTWFKLALTQNPRSADQDDPLLAQFIQKELQVKFHGKSAGELARDYLECIARHIIGKLRSMLQTDDLFNATQIDFVLTTPADWGPEYKTALRKLAREAGIGVREKDRIRLMDEPEAAALAAFHVIGSHHISKNTNVIVVDMGGGTIDVITYTVLGDLGTPRFRLTEACPGTSAKCGGTSIDLQLREHMCRRYGQAFASKDAREIGTSSKFMAHFESIKRKFKGFGVRGNMTHKLPLHMDHPWDDTYACGLVNLTRDEIAAMFNKVVEPSLDLVRKQIRNSAEKTGLPVETIVLCGGLANSPYVVQRFRKFCREEQQNQIQMIVPSDPWDAVARGGAIYGLNAKSTVRSRVCRWSYGIAIHKAFDPRVDKEENAFHCPENGKRAAGYMHWYIKQGEHIADGKANRFNGFIVVDKTKGSVGEMIVYQSHRSNPGKRVFDEDVHVLGRFRLNFDGQKFRKSSGLFTQSVVVYHKIIPDAEVVHFEAKTKNGKPLGQGHFDYEVIDLGESDAEDW